MAWGCRRSSPNLTCCPETPTPCLCPGWGVCCDYVHHHQQYNHAAAAAPALDDKMIPTASRSSERCQSAQTNAALHASWLELESTCNAFRRMMTFTTRAQVVCKPSMPQKECFLKYDHYVLTNQTVQRQSLSKNQDQNHSHKQLGLLSICPAMTIQQYVSLLCTILQVRTTA